MSIDISNYYDFFNKISSAVNQRLSTIKQENYGLQSIDDSESTQSSSSFELAFLSMINNSQPAYETLAQVAETTDLSLESSQDSSQSYDDLTTILNSYIKMKSESTIPASIKGSLFSMQNNEDQDTENMFPDYKSELKLDDIISNAAKNL